jgi:hypothetical protein
MPNQWDSEGGGDRFGSRLGPEDLEVSSGLGFQLGGGIMRSRSTSQTSLQPPRSECEYICHPHVRLLSGALYSLVNRATFGGNELDSAPSYPSARWLA